jgi:branched-chain amino acid transport system substrate-binding protein
MNVRATVAMLAAAFLIAGPVGGAAQTAIPYKLGVTFPLTGPLVTLIASSRVAVELAVDEINKAGGVKGHPLQLVFEDSQGTPQGGVAAMRKLVEVDGIQAILTIFTNVVTAQMPLGDQLKVPTLSSIESPGLVNRSQYSFAHSQTVALEAPLLLTYWKGSGYKRVYSFLGNNAFGQLVEPIVKQLASDVGAEYAGAFIDLNQTDYRGTIAKARDFNPDVIFLNAQGSTAETQVIRQIRELNITAPIYNPGNAFQDRSWRAAVGPYVEGMYFSGMNIDSRTSPAFVKAFHERAGYDPTYIAAEWYDIVRMYAYAIGKAGYNGEGIRDAIASMRGVPSVFGGNIVMGSDHYSASTGMGIWLVKGGQLIKAPPPTRKR